MLSLLFTVLTFHGAHAANIETDSFQSAIHLMQEQKFSEAALLFESEYAAGKSFPALFYNWGLNSYSLGKKGLALAMWRRALFYDPELQPAQQALAFVAKELPSQVGSGGLSGWASFRSNILDRVSLNKLLILAWLFFLSAGLLLIRYWGKFSRSTKNVSPRPSIPSVGISLAIAFSVILIVSVAKGITLFETRATVVVNSTPLRTGPNVNDNTIFELIEGFDVIVNQVQNSWALISISSGVSGWVPTETLFQHTGKSKLW